MKTFVIYLKVRKGLQENPKEALTWQILIHHQIM